MLLATGNWSSPKPQSLHMSALGTAKLSANKGPGPHSAVDSSGTLPDYSQAHYVFLPISIEFISVLRSSPTCCRTLQTVEHIEVILPVAKSMVSTARS